MLDIANVVLFANTDYIPPPFEEFMIFVIFSSLAVLALVSVSIFLVLRNGIDEHIKIMREIADNTKP